MDGPLGRRPQRDAEAVDLGTAMNDWLIAGIVVGSGALVGAPLLLLKYLERKQDRLREEKRRLQWMLDFQGRGPTRFPSWPSEIETDIVGGTPHERAGVRRYLDGHRFADQFTPPPMRKGGINDAPRGPKPPPPGHRSYRAGLEFLHEATDAPANRLRRRTP